MKAQYKELTGEDLVGGNGAKGKKEKKEGANKENQPQKQTKPVPSKKEVAEGEMKKVTR